MTNKRGRGLPIFMLGLIGATADAEMCSGEDANRFAQIEQKIVLLQRLMEDSEPLRRAERSGNPQALESIAKARQALSGARKALDEGCISDASALSSQGLKLATIAFRKSAPGSRQKRDSYEAAIQQATTFMLSLESQSTEMLGLSNEDMVGIKRQIDRAKLLATDGAFEDATQLLLPVNDRLQRRLLRMLDNKTLYYEKNFATPADEYGYLKEQYNGYLLLLQSGEKTVPYSAKKRVDSLLEDASLLRAAAENSAQAQQWQAALLSMREALKSSEQAIRAAGYVY
jgi:hypothetical protein